MDIRRVGEYLIERKLCRTELIELAVKEQSSRRRHNQYKPLGEILVELGFLTANDLDRALSEQRLEVLIRRSPLNTLPEEVLHQLIQVAPCETHPEKTVILR